jgi:hypothetical protein
MSKHTKKAAIALLALGAWLVPAGSAQAAAPEPRPAWQLALTPLPTNFSPGSTGDTATGPMFRLVATNIGGKATNGKVTLKAVLPTGLTPLKSAVGDTGPAEGGPISPTCKVSALVVTCTVSEPTYPGRWIGAVIPVKVLGSLLPEEKLSASASVEGGGADPIATTYETEIETSAPPFDFLPGAAGLSTTFTNADATPATLAGSHPDQVTVTIGFPIAQPVPEAAVTSAGHPRTLITELPPGLLGNPTATAVRCTEAELLSGLPGDPGCPAASQVGIVTAMTTISGYPILPPTNLYNMVPPPGVPAELAFNALNYDIFVHLDAEVRSNGDFGVSVRSDDIIARIGSPIMSAQAQVWGDPSAASHDEIRDVCRESHQKLCPVERRNEAFLTMPSACSGPLQTTARARSWEEPGIFRERSALSTDVFGDPVGVSGCSALEFEPSLTLRPDTSAAESPAGVRIQLHLPQHDELRDQFGNPQRATANLRDTTVTLPEGMALNPAAAGGLEACTAAQIGLETAVGQAPIHFSSERPNCPAASKVGTVEVRTPLLDHPVPGAFYVAAPYDNPFGTLLGVYVVIDDPADGIVVKLAGRTEADPVTGQLKTSFTEAPQLPFEDFTVQLKSGPRAVLRTPSACGTYATTSAQVPWSGTDPVPTTDSFAVNQGAGGGPCAQSEAQLPNSPGFQAGTETPLAGTYSPFLTRLSRADGSQQLRALNMFLPPGLSGKLAGVKTCSEAAIAAASTKTGRAELAAPSCPASSLLGTVEVGAGAGPTPYYTTGKVYLAPPYKGAPLSGVVITPAVAGPFDLGTVVVRAPAYLDPVTAQLTLRSDPFPRILEGIPLQLRDARVSLDRSQFTLNPTSCAQMAITGEAISLLGNIAPLFQRFQVGGCRALSYEPKLSLRLSGGTKRGAHPKLRAVLTAKPGQEANTAKASVALPRSEFLDNAHIQTVCTRVQFAAEQCPKGSIYGHITAITPLLDEPLSGPVYLRSSSHELPDVVASLHGPPDKPIEVELAGRIDSVRGGIRTTFDLVPDQPVSKAIFSFEGGKKGLLINSRDICARTYRASANFDAQNGKSHDFRPKLKASCGKGKASKRPR